jgi:hypothetical protein
MLYARPESLFQPQNIRHMVAPGFLPQQPYGPANSATSKNAAIIGPVD